MKIICFIILLTSTSFAFSSNDNTKAELKAVESVQRKTLDHVIMQKYHQEYVNIQGASLDGSKVVLQSRTRDMNVNYTSDEFNITVNFESEKEAKNFYDSVSSTPSLLFNRIGDLNIETKPVADQEITIDQIALLNYSNGNKDYSHEIVNGEVIKTEVQKPRNKLFQVSPDGARIKVTLNDLTLDLTREEFEDIENLIIGNNKWQVGAIRLTRQLKAIAICQADESIDALNVASSAVIETLPLSGFILTGADRIDEEYFDGASAKKQRNIISNNGVSPGFRLYTNILGGGLNSIGALVIGGGADTLGFLMDEDTYMLQETTEVLIIPAYTKTITEYEKLKTLSPKCKEAIAKVETAKKALLIVKENNETTKRAISSSDRNADALKRGKRGSSRRAKRNQAQRNNQTHKEG